MTATPSGRHAPATPSRWLSRAPMICVALLLLVLCADLAALLAVSGTILSYPYHIDYGEGIVWQQMLNIVAGRGYAPLGTFPAIVYHYPPFYHVAVAALARITGGDALLVGRLVSLLATLGSALLIARLCCRATGDEARTQARIAMFVAPLLYLACDPVSGWAPTMRVDMLAIFLSLAGLVFTCEALRQPRLIHAAAICFVLAFFTKQTAVAAPAAAMLGLFIHRPRLAWAGVATAAFVGLVLLLGLTMATDGSFLQHVIVYNMNRNDVQRLLMLVSVLLTHSAFVILAGIGTAVAVRTLRDAHVASDRRTMLLILLVYLALKTAMLAMLVKSGGYYNYMIEWLAAVAIFAGLGVASLLRLAVAGGRTRSAIVCTLILLSAWQAGRLGQWNFDFAAVTAKTRMLDRLTAAIRNSPAPVISDEMTLLVRAGRPVEWEPSIAAELASVGRYDERPFVALVRARCFGTFVTEGRRGDRLFDSRYNPAVADAMDAAYPRLFPYAGLTLHLPPHGVPPRDCHLPG